MWSVIIQKNEKRERREGTYGVSYERYDTGDICDGSTESREG